MILQLLFFFDLNFAMRKCLRYWQQDEKPSNSIGD